MSSGLTPAQRRRRRWMGAFLVLLGTLVLLAWAFQVPIATRVLEQVAQRNAGRNVLPELPDGLHVGLCGTGSPFPDPTRAGPCTVVMAGSQVFVIDAGEGSARSLAYMGIPASKITAILLTHFHSDHIDGLGPLMLQRWGLGTFSEPIPIYGPPGVDKVVDGFRAAYVLDFGYRVAHHSEKIMPAGGSGGKGVAFALAGRAWGESVVVLEQGGLKITAFRVDHSPVDPAVGYRFDYRGRSAVISGDTKKMSTPIAAFQGAELMVHEALQPKLVGLLEQAFRAKNLPNTAQIMQDIVNYHTTPEEAAQIAQAAQAKMLVLNHIVPPLPSRWVYPAFLGDAAQHFEREIVVGEDGQLFTLPAGGQDILRRQLKPW